MSSIKKELISGVLYNSIARYSGIAIQIILSAILARLIMPEEFGVVAISSVLLLFIRILTDMGISPAIIQNQELKEDDYNSLFSLMFLVGVFFSISFFFLSGPIADYYDYDILKNVCRLMSITILIGSLNTILESLLLKEKKFNLIAIRTLVAQILTGLVAVILAFRGWGVYALVSQSIFSSVFIFLFNYSKNRLLFGFNIKNALLKIWSFSLYQFLFNIVNFFSRNMDKLLVGKFMGAASLGYYEKSYRLMMMPLQNITDVVAPVILPVFSQISNDPKSMMKKYVKILELMAFVSFPLSAFLFWSAREIILIFFGNNWVLSIVPFQILSLSVSIQVLNSTTGSIYQSANKTKGLLYTGICGALFLVSSFFISIFVWGTLFAVSIGFDIALFLAASYSFSLLFKTLDVSIFVLLKVLLRPFVLFLIIFVSLYLFSVVDMPDNIILLLGIKLLMALTITIVFLLLFTNYDFFVFLHRLKNRFV